jgi:hypothetical protein
VADGAAGSKGARRPNARRPAHRNAKASRGRAAGEPQLDRQFAGLAPRNRAAGATAPRTNQGRLPHFTDPEEAPLLAGEVALHRDGAFVGLGRIAFVAPGDGLDLGFGADDKVKIQRAPVNRRENEPAWYNQSKIETREFKTSVKNLHDFPVKVQLIDQLPISENTAISVDLLPTTTPPTEKQVGDRRGVMSWTLDLNPGEAKDIRLAYRMKWPADRAVMLDGAPTDPIPQ